MKKFLLSLIALLGVVSANAQELSIADVQIVPGTQATFAIVMKNETSVRFRDSEFHFTFPAGISPVSAASGDQNIEPGTNLVGDDYRVTIAAMSDAQSQGIEGNFTVCYITVGAEAGLAEGTYTATLAKAEMTGNGELIPGTSNYEIVKKNFENITFNIVVTNVLTLDENSTAVPTSAEGVNVLVKRTIKAGEWGTICLPFDMTAEQVSEVFGENTEIAMFDSYTVDGEDATSGTAVQANTININFTSLDEIYANYPCIIKTTKDVSEFSLEAVNVVADEESATAVYEVGKKPKIVTVGTFYGKLHAGDYVPENCLFLSGGKFYYSKGKTKIKGFRGYFELKDYLADLAGAGVKMEVVVDGATAIDNVRFAEANGAVYTIDGKFVGRNVDLKKLQKGIYVVDGKKVAIK